MGDGLSYVSVLKSVGSGRHYIGCSSDPNRRLVEHNSGKTISTRGRGPWLLIYQKPFERLSDARQLETELKRKKSAKYIDWLTQSG